MRTTILTLALTAISCAAWAQPGALDPTFNPGTGADNTIRAIALQPDGKLLIGGAFTSYDGTPRNRIARLNADGSLDTSFDPGSGVAHVDHDFAAYVNTLSLQPDGNILIGGYFNTYDGAARNSIARLNADGSLDTSFDPGTSVDDGTIISIALQPDGKIIAGGSFVSFNGMPRDHIVRLNTDGSVDAGFVPVPQTEIQALHSIAVQADGKVLYSRAAHIGVIMYRLNADGTPDTDFNGPSAIGPGYQGVILPRPDGKAYLSFNHIGSPVLHIGRINADGSMDTGFDHGTDADDVVLAIHVQPDEKVIIGGGFTSYNGTARNAIARLNTDGSVDTSFDPGTGADGAVHAIAQQPDGKVIIAGGFSTYNGTVRNGVARLLADVGTGMHDGGIALNAVEAFPNPASDRVTVRTDADGDSHLLRISDPTGRVSRSIRINASATIDMGNEAPGPYIIELITAHGQRQVVPLLIAR